MSPRPARLVDPAARLGLERAVVEARRGSGAGLGVAVAGACGTYADARWRCAVLLAVATGLAGVAFAPGPALASEWGAGILGAQLVALAGGRLLARIPALRRCFVSEAALERRARERAEDLFAASSDPRHGVLVFVALFERRIVACAGDAVRAALPPGRRWAEILAPVRAGLARGDLASGLREALEACADALPPGPAGESATQPAPPRLVWLEDAPDHGD